MKNKARVPELVPEEAEEDPHDYAKEESRRSEEHPDETKSRDTLLKKRAGRRIREVGAPSRHATLLLRTLFRERDQRGLRAQFVTTLDQDTRRGEKHHE